MKFSTSKGTRMRHATGLNMKRLAKLKRRVKSLKHSTGEQTSLKHSTGKEFDYKVIYEEELEELLEEEKRLKGDKKQEENKER